MLALMRGALGAASSTTRRAAPRVSASLLSQRRSYMSAAEFSARVPQHVQKAYLAAVKDKQTTQRVGVGECHSVASTVRDLVHERLVLNGEGKATKRVATSSTWSSSNEALIDRGFPAVVRGHGATTEHSEWHGNSHGTSTGHALAVLSRTTDGGGFVVHDPDSTHAGPGPHAPSPGASLRVMSSEDLHGVRQVTQEIDRDNYSSLPVVEQRAPSLFSQVKGYLGFGDS